MRKTFVYIHRYAGLYMAFFLIVAGLTGSILAFEPQLGYWLNPEDYEDHYTVAVQAKPLLDPFKLRERALELEPGAQCNNIPVQTVVGKIFALVCEIPTHKGKTESYEIRKISLNPYTGERIPISLPSAFNGLSLWPVTRKNILPCILFFHYSLLLDEIGAKIFGIAALIWTVDCFVGFYLTLPRRRKNKTALSQWNGAGVECINKQLRLSPPDPNPKGEGIKGFWQRWQVAWKIKWPSSTQRLNFDLHRAGGLWFWPFLFIFAWSSVMFNLRDEVYNPVMNLLFEVSDADPYPNLPQPLYHPPIDFRNAYAIGKHLMAGQALHKGFAVLKDLTLEYDPAKGLYSYSVYSDRDPSEISRVTTALWFDATKGAFKGLSVSTGEKSGDTITSWLLNLHLVTIWGLPYRIFVCILGLVITMLSVTGVYIWWKKRRAAWLKGNTLA
ncbi:PepSY-associated TM helix domain-containing protein [Methyloglobulus sp.]|uniref:PepSY-associated TM helix domain-containing protein n=1 Tax=Methyloglobulus sp. TaxID=2518622 RepID=UPI0032B741C5